MCAGTVGFGCCSILGDQLKRGRLGLKVFISIFFFWGLKLASQWRQKSRGFGFSSSSSLPSFLESGGGFEVSEIAEFLFLGAGVGVFGSCCCVVVVAASMSCSFQCRGVRLLLFSFWFSADLLFDEGLYSSTVLLSEVPHSCKTIQAPLGWLLGWAPLRSGCFIRIAGSSSHRESYISSRGAAVLSSIIWGVQAHSSCNLVI